MNLTQIKKQDYQSSRAGCAKRPIFSINRKGVLAFNRGAIIQFGLDQNTFATFFKDIDEDPVEWYVKFSRTETEDSFKLKFGSGRMQFSNKLLAHEIIKSLSQKNNPHAKESDINLKVFARFQVATKPAMKGDTELTDTYAIVGGAFVN